MRQRAAIPPGCTSSCRDLRVLLPLCVALLAGKPLPDLTAPPGASDQVGPPAPAALSDTLWIADWSFDNGSPCSADGWQKLDNHLRNDGSLDWRVDARLTGTGGIAGFAGTLGTVNRACCVEANGYANDWYQAIRITYRGAATLSFDYLVDSEGDADFMQVETDSLCASFARVDFERDPTASARDFRRLLFTDSGLNLAGTVPSTDPFNPWDGRLTQYGPGTHCVTIAFFSDEGMSPCDGGTSSFIDAALVVDNIRLVDSDGTRFEDFEDGQLNLGTTINLWDSKPFGTWARTYPHVSDNDVCSENRTCAWLWTDHVTPTLANDPSTAFGPGEFVVRNWLDDIIVSPWVTLAGTAGASHTVLSFRIFPGNEFEKSRIVHSWSVRGKEAGCVAPWRHTQSWSQLGQFAWQTWSGDVTPFVDPDWSQLQIRHRVSDWQWLAGGSAPPEPFVPGPGPFVDTVRLGRIVLSGPVLSEDPDARSQGQDGFATELDPALGPGTGEHHRPTTDRLGPCAFSAGKDVGVGTSARVITADSLWIRVQDAHGAGGIVDISWHGAIVAGPHAGKAPAPWVVGANGFFVVPPDSVRRSGQVLAGFYFVDLDDTYFRGGDVLRSFWLARDAMGGATSDPSGLEAPPASVAAAEAATAGLLETSFLPAVRWAPAYVARIAADPHGDLDPSAAERAGSTQERCILYVNQHEWRRRSGDTNRTSFMFTLDRLGYRDGYDTYDHSGMGNTNNHVAGRAAVEQAQGYSLIVYDAGNSPPGSPILPDGSDRNTNKVDQANWLRAWLAQASLGEARRATLWVLGSDVLEERPTAGLFTTDMGVALVRNDQGFGVNPIVAGVDTFAFDPGTGAARDVSFTEDRFVLQGGCPVPRGYDGLAAGVAAVVTHRYARPTGELGDAAIVMNRNSGEDWNTIFQSQPWADIRDPGAPASLQPEEALMKKVLDNVLALGCVRAPQPTDAGGDEVRSPLATQLHQNAPNPFNPTTTIVFDLARTGPVRLYVLDVAGRRLRSLVDGVLPAGRDHRVRWDGTDAAGRRAGSGIYFYRLEADGFRATRKMLLLQ